MNLSCFAIIFSVGVSFSEAGAITVDEAYQSIPHKRTEYSEQESTLTPESKSDLRKLFEFSDRALVLRVETMRALRNGDVTAYLEYQKKCREDFNWFS